MTPESASNGHENLILTPQQEAVALALASGSSVREAAKDTGSGVRTITTWQSSTPAFRQRIAELRAEMTSRALGKMIDAQADAADTLRKLLKVRSNQVRLGAARALIELGSRMRESIEFEERIRRLEESRP